MKLLMSAFLASLSAWAADPVYPKAIENLKSLEMRIRHLSVWNDDEWFAKSRTVFITVSYCYLTDEGTKSTVWCRKLGESGKYVLTAPRNSNYASSVARAEYAPTSKKAIITIGPDQIKQVIALDNADGDLPHFLRVAFHAEATFSTLTAREDFRFDEPSLFSEFAQVYAKQVHHAFGLSVSDGPSDSVTISAVATFR